LTLSSFRQSGNLHSLLAHLTSFSALLQSRNAVLTADAPDSDVTSLLLSLLDPPFLEASLVCLTGWTFHSSDPAIQFEPNPSIFNLFFDIG
jgi:hypothetical protein